MYKIEKKFSLPIGHRLSKHNGRCFSIHGHNILILVGIKATTLDKNDMVMDFSDLKKHVGKLLNDLDHCLLLNETDKELGDQLEKMGMRVITFKHDPTAEKLAEILYYALDNILPKIYPNVIMDYVTVYENENSKATYCIEIPF